MSNLWLPNEDYIDNIEFKYEYEHIKGDTLISAKEFKDSKLIIDDNVTLTFTGDAKFIDTEVTLGHLAHIVIEENGSFHAENSTFTSKDPENDKHDLNKGFGSISIFSENGNSQIINSTIKGGYYGIEVWDGYGNITVENSEIKHNHIGISAFGNSTFSIVGSQFVDNSQYGIYGGQQATLNLSGYHDEYNDGYYDHTIFYPVKITDNAGRGISLGGNATMYKKETRVLHSWGTDDDHAISVGNSARLYMEGGPYGLLGDNRVGASASGDYHIYNNALTEDGEHLVSWTIPAQYNYWGDGSQPDSDKFFGSVDYSNHLSEDPTVPIEESEYNPSCDDDPTDPACSEGHATSVITSGMADSYTTAYREQSQALPELTPEKAERILALQTQMENEPDHLLAARRLSQWHDLVRVYDPEDVTGSRESLTSIQQSFRGQLQNTNPNLEEKDWETPGYERVFVLQTRAEAALINELRGLNFNRNYEQVLQESTEWYPSVQLPDHRQAVLTQAMVALKGLERYGDALEVLEQIEAIKPDEALSEYHEPGDPVLRTELTRLADSGRDQSTGFGLTEQGYLVDEQVSEAGNSAIPEVYQLSDNYPNPFNPVTTLPFGLPEEAEVHITVYDILGRRVATLADETFGAGYHTIQMDGTRLSSGTYIIRAVLGNQQFSQQINLVK